MPICQGCVQKFKYHTLLLKLIYINMFYARVNSKLQNDLLASSVIID